MSKNKVSTFCNDVLGKLDATAIAEGIAKGDFTAQEATEAAIKRAESASLSLGAVAFEMYENAKATASQKRTGALSGVPTFIKDNEDIAGTPKQIGTLAFKSKLSKRNSKFVDQYLSTGMNVLGKTTLPEFGLICSTENPKWAITRNPWHTDYTPGGSSSGSAAMVASGVVPIAHANDGAGSTRIPASCCGLVGLKPSRNRLVNFEGSEILPINIGYQGVVTRSVRDTALFYAEAEKHFASSELPKMGHITSPLKKRLKFVFFENISADKLGFVDLETQKAMMDTADLLSSLGHIVEQKPFPIDVDNLSMHFLNYYGLVAYSFKNLGRYMFNAKVDKSQLEPFTVGLSKQFRQNLFSIPKSLKALKTAGQVIDNYFNDYDIIMSPVMAHTVPKIGHFSVDLDYAEVSKRAVGFAPFTGIQNITGAPAISLPLSMSSDGLPLGIQFSSALGQDALLLELAYELEQAKPWSFLYDS